jgi:DNA-binding transcriptional LysR family regulator
MSDDPFDGNLLRTFVAVADCGGFTKAAARQHVTQSTVSQQMRRLEERAGKALFAPVGRQRMLTEAGELLLGYARNILALHDRATAGLRIGEMSGVVRIGAPQDFAERRLPSVLRAFARSHKSVRVEVRVGASRELRSLLAQGALDATVVLDDGKERDAVVSRRCRASWIAAHDFRFPREGEPWPLALFEAPCIFRDAALGALNAAGLPWTVAYTSPSLSGVLAAVRAGLAITVRLASDARGRLRALGREQGLPALGSFRVGLLSSLGPTPAAAALIEALRADPAFVEHRVQRGR